MIDARDTDWLMIFGWIGSQTRHLYRKVVSAVYQRLYQPWDSKRWTFSRSKRKKGVARCEVGHWDTVLNSWLVISNNTHLSLTVSHGKVSSLLGLKVGVCLDLNRLWVKLAPGSTLVGNREIKEDRLDLQKMEAPLIQNWEKPSCPSSQFINTVNSRFIDAEQKNNTTIATSKPKQDNHRALFGQKSWGSQVKPTTLYPQCRCKLSDVESKQYKTYSMYYKYSKYQNNKTCNMLQ